VARIRVRARLSRATYDRRRAARSVRHAAYGVDSACGRQMEQIRIRALADAAQLQQWERAAGQCDGPSQWLGYAATQKGLGPGPGATLRAPSTMPARAVPQSTPMPTGFGRGMQQLPQAPAAPSAECLLVCAQPLRRASCRARVHVACAAKAQLSTQYFQRRASSESRPK
jgi:hypothetical protein